MSAEEQRSQVVRYWWLKAEERLASARREMDFGAFAFAMNRVYYAAFYAVSAALLDRRHSKNIPAFGPRFIVNSSKRGCWIRAGESFTTGSLKTVRKATT
jgi:uncharacterized protein (UPF0332 family)